jgi:predicted negative regulator of RcsB-dependent stress response
MGFRFRKSVKIMPGLRLNFSKSGVGLSAGVRGARVSINSRGRMTRSVGIPGTGIGYVTSSSLTGSSRRTSRSSTRSSSSHSSEEYASWASSQTVGGAPPKWGEEPAGDLAVFPLPTMFAPPFEKRLQEFLAGKIELGKLRAVENLTDAERLTILFVEAVRVSIPAHDNARTLTLLRQLVAAHYHPAADELLCKYSSPVMITVHLAEGIAAELPLYNSDTLALMLAELEQSVGNLDDAIAVVEGVDPSTLATVSLAELYIQQQRWADVVTLTDELTNEDESSMYALIQRAVAFREQKYFEAARTSLKEALRVRSRDTELRQLALVERGKTYLAEGKKAMARKDFETVLAGDSTYTGLIELIESAS